LRILHPHILKEHVLLGFLIKHISTLATSATGRIQTSSLSAAAAVWPKAKCPTVQSWERRQSMFQLRQYFPFFQELPATQEILSGAELQPEQQGQGQEANGASPTGAS
jgi:hypothetical protein